MKKSIVRLEEVSRGVLGECPKTWEDGLACFVLPLRCYWYRHGYPMNFLIPQGQAVGTFDNPDTTWALRSTACGVEKNRELVLGGRQ